MNVADLLTRRARLDAHSVALLTDRDTLGTGALEERDPLAEVSRRAWHGRVSLWTAVSC